MCEDARTATPYALCVAEPFHNGYVVTAYMQAPCTVRGTCNGALDVLVGAVRAALVDLDRAAIVPALSDEARVGMLARMQRYLDKHRAALAEAPSKAETMRFLAVLEPDRRRRHALWRAVQARRVG